MNKEDSLFSFMSTIWKFDENNSFDNKRKELIQALKLNVKTLMEYAVVCRSIPEDSIHVINFCELVHECLRNGLRTSSFLFYQNITTYSLLHKISNHCESALKVINKFEKHCDNNHNCHGNIKNNSNHHHHHHHLDDNHHHPERQRSSSPPPPQQQQQQTWLKNKKKLNFQNLFHSFDNNKIKNCNDNNCEVMKRRIFCSKLSYNSNIAWIHFALIEKLLKTIIQHICLELKECYNSDSIVANECDMNVFLSLINGPCTINYSSSIHYDDSYWYNLHANELVERQRFNLITNHNHFIGRTLQTYQKMKSFLMLQEDYESINDRNEKLKGTRNTSSIFDASFTNMNVDSLYQTRKCTLLYGKNNVILGDNRNSLGYLELINSTHNLLLRWTSNDLLLQASNVHFYDYHNDDSNTDPCLLNNSMNEMYSYKVIDKHKRLQYSLSFNNDNVDNYQLGIITVSMNKMEYVHLHQDTTSQEYGLILIGLDGIAHPPIRLQGGFNAVYNFLMCLDQGLQPNACLNPSPNSLIDNKLEDIEFNEKQQITIKFWHFLDFHNKSNELKDNCNQFINIETKNFNDVIALNEISYHDDDKNEKMINLKNDTINKTNEVIFKIIHMEITTNNNDECIHELYNTSINDNLLKSIETFNQHKDDKCQKVELFNSMNIIDAIKLQLISRTFKSWFEYTRHMKNVRELLSPLVIHSNRNFSNSVVHYEKLTKTKWNELFLNISDKQNFDPYCIYECIYYGGCAAELRTEVWPYLLGVYDWKMTNEEKITINKQLKVHYVEKLQEWTKLEKIIRNIEENETMITSSLSHTDNDYHIGKNKMENSSPTLLEYDENIIKQFSHALDSVKKDVVRCDRNNCFYSKFDLHGDRNLATIQRILLTYVWEFLDDEYTQGMCDIVAPLLVLQLDNSITLSSNSSHSNHSLSTINNEETIEYSKEMLLHIEIETYILFKQIMRNRLKKLFAKETATIYMDEKFDHIKALIQILDPQLISHLQKFSDFTHFYFCYRWFLLDFKREFTYEDVFQIWEVILCAEHIISNDFSLFIALALIQNYRDVISSNHMEFTDILKFFNERAEHHNVEQILNLARYFADSVQRLTSKTNET
ncbi:hypothetical protein MN116_005571 [Schistosoma mekongi]|uniref:Rab-GAP TBC domain-containing protein n=1 Tax=Schistosoma mekongi TaxID=38744 RepID=A0AAE1ZCU6_SCHME|nr:hypothetical protein MN116_005571 [Schistosoma mekongi]